MSKPIQTITEKRAIEGVDSVEAARVDGWWTVLKKGELCEDVRCAYFEIDSLSPVRTDLKTVKLRGQLSAGLVIPSREEKNGGETSEATLKLEGWLISRTVPVDDIVEESKLGVES